MKGKKSRFFIPLLSDYFSAAVLFCIISVLLMPASALAFKGGIPVCLDYLNNCSKELVDCSKERGACSKDLEKCSKDLGQCSKELGNCSKDLVQAQTDLLQAQMDLAECQAELDELKKKPPAPLPRTGQEPYVFSVPAPGGSDGSLQKGVVWPNPRFTDNSDGTVTDNLTGLIWLKNTSCTNFFSGDSKGQNQRLWNDALRAANALASGFCGLDDGSLPGQWRLPNLRELLSLVHYGLAGPALPNTAGTERWTEGDPFIGIQSSYYWSSSSKANVKFGFNNDVWTVNMLYGTTGFYSSNNTLTFLGVWPVRSEK